MSPSTGTTYSASVLILLVSYACAGEGTWEASFSEELGHQPHFVTAPQTAMKWQQEPTKIDPY